MEFHLWLKGPMVAVGEDEFHPEFAVLSLQGSGTGGRSGVAVLSRKS